MQMVRLKDICVGKGEYGIAASAEDFASNKYRYLRITDISDFGELLNNDCKSVSCDSCEKYLLSEDEIVFARTGNSTGRAFFYEKKYGPLVYAGFLIKFHIDRNKVNPKFLKYYTISKTYKDWIANGPTGSTRGNMSEGDFADMPVFLPSRQVQDSLVAMMEPIDDKINNNTAICSDLEGMAKLLYDYWFVQFDFPDENGKPYKSSGGKMVWNDELKREIPAGWEVGRLEHYCQFENGDRGSNYPSGDDFILDGIPFVAGGALKDNEIEHNEVRYISEEKFGSLRAGKARKGDILMTLRGSLTKCVYSPYDRMAIASALVIVRPINGVTREYLHRVLISDYYVQLLKNYDNGSVQANLSVDTVKSFPMIFPTKSIMDSFTQNISIFEEREVELREENQQLASLRDFLLPMLMNGQVKIKNNEA